MEQIELTPVRDTLHLAPSIAPKIAFPSLNDLATKIPTPSELLQGISTPEKKEEKDPYKIAEEAYLRKKPKRIDTSSAIAPTETITPEEYKRFNNDDTISSSVKYDPNYEANKRATQTLGERFTNTAQKFGANATSMFLGGLSTIPNILGSITNGIGYLSGQETPISEYFNMSPDSGVMKDLFEWSDGVNQNNRNYQSNWSKENWIQDLIPFYGDGGFQDVVASAGYTVGAIGEAWISGGIGSILSKGTKLAGMGGKISKYLNDPAKIDKILDAIVFTKNSKASQLLGDAGYLMGKSIENSPQLYRAYVGAHVEAAFEGLEGAKRFEEDVIGEYKKNHGGAEPSEKELAKIKDLAQNVGDLRYKLNLLTLTIPNYIQMGSLLKTFPGASKVAKSLLGKNELGSIQIGEKLGSLKVVDTPDIKFNTTSDFWEKRIPKAFKKGAETTLSYGQKFGKIPLSVSEGLEEGMQYFIDEHTTSLYKGAYLNEKTLEDNSLYLSGLWDVMKNKASSKEAAQAFLMGSMGGGMQQSMNTVYEMVFERDKLKQKISQNELYAKKLEDISNGLFTSSDAFNLATDEEKAQLENYLSKALNQNSLNGTLQENYQNVLATLNSNAVSNLAIQKNFLGAQRIYQDLQDRDVSGLLHSVVATGKQEVFKEHLETIANATEEQIQNLYGVNPNEQTRNNKVFAKNLISKLNQIEGYAKKIGFAFNDSFEDETDADFYLKYKNELSHSLYMMNRKQERINELSTPNSAFLIDLLQDKKQSINDKIEELKTASSLVPIKDAKKRIALLEKLKEAKTDINLKDAIYAYSGESVAELEAISEFEKANDSLMLKEGKTGIDNIRKYYEELYSTKGFDIFKENNKEYYETMKSVRAFHKQLGEKKQRDEKQYAQLQKDLLEKTDVESSKKIVQKLSEDISKVEDDVKFNKEQKEKKKKALIDGAKQKIARIRNSAAVETEDKKTPKTETTKETEVVVIATPKIQDVENPVITTEVAQKFSEAPIIPEVVDSNVVAEEDLDAVNTDDWDEETPVITQPLIEEEGNVKQGNTIPIVDVKADIERRRQEKLKTPIEQITDPNDPFFEVGTWNLYGGEFQGKTKQEVIDKINAKYDAELVEQLRKEEQAEYAEMSNPNDETKKKEIYDKYDKLISPLLKTSVTPAVEETPVTNLPFDDTNFFGAPPIENTIPEVLVSKEQGFQILQPEYYIALTLLNTDEASEHLQRRKQIVNNATSLSEISTTIKEVTYRDKAINRTINIFGDVFVKLGGGKLYHLLHTNDEGVETILYEFRSLKHGFGLQKTWTTNTYPRIAEELAKTEGLLETTEKSENGKAYSNKQYFPNFSQYYSLYDVWNLMNEDERSDFLHKFNIRPEQMKEAFDTQNVFEQLLASPDKQYKLNRILEGWVHSSQGNIVASYAVDFEKQVSIDTLPQSKFIDVETGNQHHVVVYADFELLYDGEGNLKEGIEYRLAKEKVIDGMQVRVDGVVDSSRISNYILDNLIAQLNSDKLEPVHFLSSGYNLVLSDTNGKPYIKSLSPTTDLKDNEVLNEDLHALVENPKYNGKSTREAGFHILLNNLSKTLGHKVEVTNVKFNFYTKQDEKRTQSRTIAITLEWVDKGEKKNKTFHVSLKPDLEEEGRYGRNISAISKGLIEQVKKEFKIPDSTTIFAKFVAAEAKEPADVATILKNNNSVELGVLWKTNDFRKGNPVLFNTDRIVPKIVEESITTQQTINDVSFPVVSTKVEEAKKQIVVPIIEEDVSPIQAMVNKHIGAKGMILQRDRSAASDKVLIFEADAVKLIENSEIAKAKLEEAMKKGENEAHTYLRNVLSLFYFNSKFENLRPYFSTTPKPIDSNCILKLN